METCFVVVLDGLAETKSALRMGIMVGSHRSQSLLAHFTDPGGWGKVHVPLAKIDAVRGKICRTAIKKSR